MLLVGANYINRSGKSYYQAYPDLQTNEAFKWSDLRFWISKGFFNIGKLNEYIRIYEFPLVEGSMINIEHGNGMGLDNTTTRSNYIVGILPIDQSSFLRFGSHITECSDDDNIETDLKTACQGKTECQVEVKANWFDQSCLAKYPLHKGYFKIKGNEGNMKLLWKFELTETKFNCVYIGVLALIFAFLASQYTRLGQIERQAIWHQRAKFPQPSDYTVELTGLGEIQGETDVKNEGIVTVKKYADRVLQKSEKNDQGYSKLYANPDIADIFLTIDCDLDDLQGRTYSKRKQINELYEQLKVKIDMTDSKVSQEMPQNCAYLPKVQTVIQKRYPEKSIHIDF